MLNYRLVSFYCRCNPKGGGVAIYVKNNADFQMSEISNIKLISVDKVLEVCAVDISISGRKLKVITFYRSPEPAYVNDFFVKLYDVLSRICRNCRDVVIISGDFNVDRLVDSDEKFELQNILRNFNIEILSNEPTRITPTSATCLDGIFTETSKIKSYTHFVDHNGLADHSGQILRCQLRVNS
ncbi:Endonuclease-reverse transcriptase [Popillia japonica]|uniref:Endonuclease-reverse transcriptase n=1 Tax=Popillia japonica TaxID=7064 RepID=A0AAW1KYD9_POPJA